MKKATTLDQSTLSKILIQTGASRRVRRLVQKRQRKIKMSKKMKRYIRILEPAVVMQIDGVTPSRGEDGQTYEEEHPIFIRNRTTDPAFVSETPLDRATVHWSMPMIVAAETVRAAVRGLKPGDVLELDEDDWQLLKRATEKGNYGLGAGSCIHFMRSITGAPMEHPDKGGKKSDKKESSEEPEATPEGE